MGDRPRNDQRPAVEPIVTARDVPADRADVFAVLDDLDNHDWIGGRWLDVAGVHRSDGVTTGADLVLRRPFFSEKLAMSRIQRRRQPDLLAGTVEIRGVAVALLRWELIERSSGTRVRVAVTPTVLRLRDRLWLAAGGRRWIEGRIAAMLARLADHVAAP